MLSGTIINLSEGGFNSTGFTTEYVLVLGCDTVQLFKLRGGRNHRGKYKRVSFMSGIFVDTTQNVQLCIRNGVVEESRYFGPTVYSPYGGSQNCGDTYENDEPCDNPCADCDPCGKKKKKCGCNHF